MTEVMQNPSQDNSYTRDLSSKSIWHANSFIVKGCYLNYLSSKETNINIKDLSQ